MKLEVKVYHETQDNVVFSAYVDADYYMALAECEEISGNSGLFISWKEFSDFFNTELNM